MRPLKLASLSLVCLCVVRCGGPAQKADHVEAVYDKTSGKLSQLTVNAVKDGKPDIYSYMNGTKFVRIEVDENEDGKIDRWEYYGPDQKIEKVGLSRANDGKQDAWVYRGPDGTASKIEVSTHHDGKVNRVEFYEKGALTRVEEDGDGDGRPDKWETYENGALTTASFDTQHTGKPDKTIDYREAASK
jgi:hypothetical protein